MQRNKSRDANAAIGVNGEKVPARLILEAGTNAKMAGLARHSGYTITDLVERGGQRQGQGVYTLLMESRRRDYAGTAALSMARRLPSTK